MRLEQATRVAANPSAPATMRLTQSIVGMQAVPYLADHGFQDMVVLPGSYYIDMAVRMHCASGRHAAAAVRNVTFHNPVILGKEDTVIEVEWCERIDGAVEYAFYEAASGKHGERMLAATLDVGAGSWGHAQPRDFAPSAAAVKARSHAVIGADELYRTLRRNGNQYGPAFANVLSIWQAGDEMLGLVRVPTGAMDPLSSVVDPRFVDAVTQVLSPFVMGDGRTFVLRSIECIEVPDAEPSGKLWAHATVETRPSADSADLRGSVRVFDDAGKFRMELRGVALRLLERTDAARDATAPTVNVAANFTADPLEESLRFWADHLGTDARIQFAPYDQIFQELLDETSSFRTNRDGANAILLRLEAWATSDRPPPIALHEERANRCFGARARRVLPNGLTIVHLNAYETDYLYKEVFEDECYLRHGIRLRDGATVLDVGANIGLFSLFVMSRCKDPVIYAFEPAPVVYDLLRANCEAYGAQTRAINAGVSDRSGTATFTFYDKSSVFSGFHSDDLEDRAAIQAVVRNIMTKASVPADAVDELVREITADRLTGRSHECKLVSISDVIREHRIETVDLLKIDAEKSEIDIIDGIEEGDWPKIRQIVVEIHDRTRKRVDQVRELLQAKGYRCVVDQETLLENAGLFNLYASRNEAGYGDRPAEDPSAPEAESESALQRNCADFLRALRSFMQRSATPLLLCFTPSSPAPVAAPRLKSALDAAEAQLLVEAGAIANVHCVSSATLMEQCPASAYHDPDTDRVAHIPYTAEGYAAIGTSLVRTLANLGRSPLKVIVLDCDNTLWQGVCGEDGPSGIVVSAPYRALQEFMIRQQRTGMLLALCSKNNERDVLDVFERRNDMPLRREHLVSWRINWKSKSENIESLAQELDLGLDSFVFVDDNPMDCADVRSRCPGVLTLQLPADPTSFERFLRSVWAFDRSRTTEEDRNRTRMYRQNAERQRFRKETISLRDFVDGLGLSVRVSDAADDDLARVSQLTFRTNQFNLCTTRRSERDIRDYLAHGDRRCQVVRVTDRFGDYGLVGVVMYEVGTDRVRVDDLLLSCRVLGRGVEHAVMAEIGRGAIEAGKGLVEIAYRQTAKNQPALEFMTSIGAAYRSESGESWIFPADVLSKVRYVPNDRPPDERPAPREIEISGTGGGPRNAFAIEGADRSVHVQRIADDLFDASRVAAAIERHRMGQVADGPASERTPAGALEAALAGIWRKVLRRPRLGIADNFFEAGGTSLNAVQVIAMIKKELKQSVSIVSLFECPTVQLLAAKLQQPDAGGGAAGADATSRGQQRRYGALRRKAS
jgi:FkbH-like protein/FkbM family methyltransferase